MTTVSVAIAKAKNNVIGLLVGAGAGFLVGKKVIKSEKIWVLVASSVVGAVVGVTVQSKMSAKASVPTASTVATTPTKK